MEQVMILLATYNGEKYVAEMIDSVIAQDWTDWKLILSDDGSTDSTPAILQRYADMLPEKITFYRSGKRFGNAQRHFMHLLEHFHDAAYMMFCDQDDIWHSDKIRKTYEKMRQTEQKAQIPALVHTDLRVVDAQLREISPSFCALSNLDGNRMGLNQLLVQNVVTGCTVMINRALAELATRNIPEEGMLMHDGWLALLASACGNVGFLNEATMDYRQHGNNTVGATNTHSLKEIIRRMKGNQATARLQATYFQAEVFLRCFENELPADKRDVVSAYAALLQKNGIARRAAYLRHGFWKSGFLRKIGQLVFG